MPYTLVLQILRVLTLEISADCSKTTSFGCGETTMNIIKFDHAQNKKFNTSKMFWIQNPQKIYLQIIATVKVNAVPLHTIIAHSQVERLTEELADVQSLAESRLAEVNTLYKQVATLKAEKEAATDEKKKPPSKEAVLESTVYKALQAQYSIAVGEISQVGVISVCG